LAASDGLLLVLSEPGRVPLAEFHRWYDTDHGPPRLRVPGVHAGHRFRAADGEVPGWLAVYLLRLAALESPEYAAVRGRSPYEQTVVERLATLDRRVYARIADGGGDGADFGADFGAGPAPAAVPLLLTVGLTSTAPAQLDAWYAEEHVPLLRAVPGWLRTTRYRLLEGAGPDRLAVHELAGPDVFDTAEYRRAVSTPRRAAVLRTVTQRERRLFTHHRTLLATDAAPR
jgi:hypothetical protein